MIDRAGIKARFETLAPHLDERARRLLAATEAHAAGRGGVAAVSEATGLHAVRLAADSPNYGAPRALINIDRDPFHGEWNYTISPNLLRPMTVIENGSGNDRRP